MKTIFWDADDVLFPLMELWLKDWKSKNPNKTISFSQITVNPPHALLSITLNNYLKDLDRFRLSSVCIQAQPYTGLREWFRQNGRYFHHAIITQRSMQTIPPLASWIFTHFGNWIRSFYFIPAARSRQNNLIYDEDKATLLKRLNLADYFIDDDPRNIATAQKVGIKSLLFPQPWNHSKMNHAKFIENLTTFLEKH